MNNIIDAIKQETEVAWAAGFYDGEGTIYVHRVFSGKARNLKKYVSVSVTQTCREPLDRLMRALGGIGNVSGPYRDKHKNHKPHWLWCTNADFREAMDLLWPYLSSPKRLQAMAVFAEVAAHEDI